ncbi:MAG TPA: choice-of-anchor tandem repeat GloVer-containing protein [Verrucomicrobiae bacterium]|nr:choice-of-anchor tandem repeat GloVer-containing protein [Verrucomicrobiae bacterium]
MKTTFNWALAVAAIFPAAISNLPAQNLAVLHAFSPVDFSFANQDGAYPTAELALLGNVLYGAASQGGQNSGGTLFTVGTNGTGFKTLHSFTPGSAGDGAYPMGGLAESGGNLFGTASSGGRLNTGAIFRLNLDGTGFTNLYAFSATDISTGTNADGSSPWAALAVSGTTLFGTATQGGDAGSGTIFKISTDGTGFVRLHSFGALDPASGTNSDGAFPLGGVVVWSNTLYGTTYRGGALGTGTVFTLNLDGSGFKTLKSLDGGSRAALAVINGGLYGTTEAGGAFGGGTVFKMNTDGTGFTNLVNFANTPGDGPWAGLVLSSNNVLFGTTHAGGDAGQGSVFQLALDGTGFQTVYSFSGGNDGGHPQARLTQAGNVLFGTASDGSTSGDGDVFSLTPSQTGAQQLAIEISGSNVILQWPNSGAGSKLQVTRSLSPPITWSAVQTAPAVVNGFNTVTNPISGSAGFYRLSP